MKRLLIGLLIVLLLTGCGSAEVVHVAEIVEPETTSQEPVESEDSSQEPITTITEETAVDRINNYFNFNVKKDYDISTEYTIKKNYEGFYFDYIVEPVVDDSEESLEPIITKFAEYLPGHLFRIMEAYNLPTPCRFWRIRISDGEFEHLCGVYVLQLCARWILAYRDTYI